MKPSLFIIFLRELLVLILIRYTSGTHTILLIVATNFLVLFFLFFPSLRRQCSICALLNAVFIWISCDFIVLSISFALSLSQCYFTIVCCFISRSLSVCFSVWLSLSRICLFVIALFVLSLSLSRRLPNLILSSKSIQCQNRMRCVRMRQFDSSLMFFCTQTRQAHQYCNRIVFYIYNVAMNENKCALAHSFVRLCFVYADLTSKCTFTNTHTILALHFVRSTI